LGVTVAVVGARVGLEVEAQVGVAGVAPQPRGLALDVDQHLAGRADRADLELVLVVAGAEVRRAAGDRADTGPGTSRSS
jgi:hypothetical protein